MGDRYDDRDPMLAPRAVVVALGALIVALILVCLLAIVVLSVLLLVGGAA